MLYHGCSRENNIQKILSEGYLQPGVPQGTASRRYLQPLSNRVYLTTDLSYALVYALGANMVGSDHIPEVLTKEGPRGVVFVVEPEQTLLPDEDWVGQQVADYILSPNDGIGKRIYNSLPNSLKNRINSKTRFKLYEVAVQAMLGKGIIKWMVQRNHPLLPALTQASPHKSHTGRIKVLQAWAFDKKLDNPQLKQDGSNFFQIAKPVTLAVAAKNSSWLQKIADQKTAARYRAQPTLDSYNYYRPAHPLYEPEHIYQSADFPYVFLGSSNKEDLEQAAHLAGVRTDQMLRFDVANHETPRDLPEPTFHADLKEGNPQVGFMDNQAYHQQQQSFNNAADALVKLITSTNRPIYVHCVAGANRSAAVLAAALTSITNRSIIDILKEMKSQRMEIGLHDAYFMMAVEYSKSDSEDWKDQVRHKLDLDLGQKPIDNVS